MFVAVSYDIIQIIHSNQYNSFFSYAVKTEADVAVFGKNQDSALAIIGFNQTNEEHLKGFDETGKLVRQGLSGQLRDKRAIDQSQR